MFNRILKQPMMNRVIYALIPSIVFAIYLFGWRSLAVIIASNIGGFLAEYIFIYNKKAGKVSSACFVTSTLVAMTLPPTIPLWIAALSAIVSISFGKMVFGGFGTNPFNPAILGRTFVYVSFPQQMTVNWVNPYTISDFPGGFIRWAGSSEMMTSATILGQYRLNNPVNSSFMDAFLGYIPGSIGETSAILIVLAGLYLVISKTAKWQPMLVTLISVLIFNLIFYPQDNPFFMLVSGGVLFGIVYMTTDPVSQPKNKISLYIYGLLIGFLTVYIRKFSLFAEGFMFALLLTNSFMPIIEYGIEKYLPSKKVIQ